MNPYLTLAQMQNVGKLTGRSSLINYPDKTASLYPVQLTLLKGLIFQTPEVEQLSYYDAYGVGFTQGCAPYTPNLPPFNDLAL